MPRLLLELLFLYSLGLVLLYFYQRRLMYFPSVGKLPTPASVNLKMQVLTIATEDGLNLAAWFAPPLQRDSKIVVMFHGNAGNIADRRCKASTFIDKGYGLFMCEYRGYGGNPGTPTEAGLYKDARAGIKWLLAQGYSPQQLVMYGESLGTGVAVQMAGEFAARYVILEAPYSSTLDLAREKYWFVPVDHLMHDTYDSLAKIAKIKPPLLVVHGDRDATIPIRFAQKLFKAANHPKEFVTINGGGHSDLYDHKAGEIITAWLERQGK